jgi:hypothetical protein
LIHVDILFFLINIYMNEKLLTIGMATYDDYDGVFFTIQCLRLYHPICSSNQVEFIVIDNNPESKQGKAIKGFVENKIKGKYIPYTETQSSFTKYKIADHASGKYVLVMDCHVLPVSGAIDTLLEYYKNNPDCKNLVQGPLLYDDLKTISTHFEEKWGGHMWGTWGTNKKAYSKGEPFEIPMQGMGLFSFETKNWPGISKHFKGFGGEEGYVAEKFRQNGGKNICLPDLKWLHRFGRPAGIPFKCTVEDRVWNYFVGWMEINKYHPMIINTYDYFKTQIKEETVKRILEKARDLYACPGRK